MTQTAVAIEPRRDADNSAARTHERRRFQSALFFSGLGHAAVIVLLLALWQPEADEIVPLPPIPVTVIQEQEGQSGAAGGGNGDTAASASSAASTAASSANPTQTPPAQTQEQQPQQAETQPEPPQPVAAPQARTPPPTDALHLTQAPRAMQPTPPESPPEPVPPRKPIPPRPKPTVVAQARPSPPTPPMPQPLVKEAAQAPAASSTSTSGARQGSNAPLPAGVGGPGRGEAGTGRAEIGNGSANGTADDYLAKIRLWILRFAHPPDDDCSRKHGDGSLDVTFLRDGTVIGVELTHSSGCPASDAEALRMVHAASPLPPVPPQFPGEPKKIALPFDFRPGLLDRLFHGR